MKLVNIIFQMSVQMINFDAGYIWLKVPSTLHVMWDTFISQTPASPETIFWKSLEVIWQLFLATSLYYEK